MKRRGGAWLLILFFSLPATAKGDDPHRLFDLANRYYAEQAYEKAITTYQQILDQGFYHAALFYNLGNAYYKQGELGRAVLNYEKSLLLWPTDPEIRENLAFLRERLIDQVLWQEPSAPLRLIYRIVQFSPPRGYFFSSS